MGLKANSAFLNAYIELDNVCCEKFGISRGGVTEYLNRLIEMRFAPDRDEVLPKLVNYRNIRNRMAHDEGALHSISDIAKADAVWLTHLAKKITKGKDPVSRYTRKAKRYAVSRLIFAILKILLIAGVVVGAIFALKYFNVI
jgi:hypothetical protein